VPREVFTSDASWPRICGVFSIPQDFLPLRPAYYPLIGRVLRQITCGPMKRYLFFTADRSPFGFTVLPDHGVFAWLPL